jgi:ribonuclease G
MDIGISFSFDVEPPAATLGDAAGESPASTGASAPEPGADASEAREAAETADVEPARMPVSLTAQLRERGGRLPHRVNRRMRRRGRGGRGFEAPETPAEVEAPASAPEVTVVQAEEPARPPRQERDRDRGRDRVRDRDRDRERDQDRERPKTALPSIADLLKEGQEIIVQIAKEPLGQKGARITSHIALPGRYVVYMPTVEHLGVSRKISTEEERLRLKRILQKHRQDVPGGYIMRTAGEDKSEDDIASDMKYLANLWQEIRTKSDKRRAPALLHHDVQVVERLLRDQLTEGFKAVWVDSEELFEGVLHTVERMQPALLARVKLYTRAEPIFDAFGITQELEKALRPKVWLRSGGYIVINQTEALVAIDVNTGKYVGKSNRLEDTIVKTNLEAVREISRQVRLRDLGGIIVIDFIDMDERKNRQKVMQALEDAMRADKAPYKILQFNDFGLVAVTRKRVKQSLERALCAPCPMCEGAGYVKSVQTVIGEIMGQAQKYAKVVDGKECLLRVHPDAAKVLKSTQNKYLEELEEILGRPVLVTADAQLHPEKFDLT